MPKYVEYDATGKILCFGMCTRQSFISRTLAGRKLLEVPALSPAMDIAQKVVDDKIVAKTVAEIAADKKL